MRRLNAWKRISMPQLLPSTSFSRIKYPNAWMSWKRNPITDYITAWEHLRPNSSILSWLSIGYAIHNSLHDWQHITLNFLPESWPIQHCHRMTWTLRPTPCTKPSRLPGRKESEPISRNSSGDPMLMITPMVSAMIFILPNWINS